MDDALAKIEENVESNLIALTVTAASALAAFAVMRKNWKFKNKG